MDRPTRSSFDWFRFWVRFFFGALLGLIVGIGFWVRSETGADGWVIVLGCVIVLGVVAGLWGDAFWEGLRNWLPWVS